jgi:hypothetical protein
MSTHKATDPWDALTKGLMVAKFVINSWPLDLRPKRSGKRTSQAPACGGRRTGKAAYTLWHTSIARRRTSPRQPPYSSGRGLRQLPLRGTAPDRHLSQPVDSGTNLAATTARSERGEGGDLGGHQGGCPSRYRPADQSRRAADARQHQRRGGQFNAATREAEAVARGLAGHD